MARFREQIRAGLQELEEAGLLRRPLGIEGPQGPEIQIDGRAVLCFCSNNYLGLADHPDLLAAADQREGYGAGASRLITGTMSAHQEAESALADFVSAPAAALFANGERSRPWSAKAMRSSATPSTTQA